MSSSEDGYDPTRSTTSPDTLAAFMQRPLTGSLTADKIPSVGPKTIEVLKEHGITSTYSLIGKFMSLKEEGVGSVEHMDRCWFWLKSIGTPPGHRSCIIEALAQRMNMHFPGLYDEARYT
jgi:hypothetical protein